MTKTRCLIHVGLCWVTGLTIGLLPVLSGFYSTHEHLQTSLEHPETCEFKVNKIFSVIAPLVSFILPATFMVFAYVRYDT